MKRDTSAARAAAAAARAGRRAPSTAPSTGSSTRSSTRSSAASVVWVYLLGVLALLLLALGISGVATAAAPTREGLVPWTGGRSWRTRAGQWIDPAAAQSLREVGDQLQDCAVAPMTLDVSREGGGPFPPHKSHQRGVDVDIRMSDLTPECRKNLQAALTAAGWRVWYDGPDAVSPEAGGVHKTHLHARFGQT